MFDCLFDNIPNRRGWYSYKWDSTAVDGVIPLWVADMDFKAAPAIIDALQRRVQHGVFGYTHVPEEYYKALYGWYEKRYGADISRAHVIYTSGVVPAISVVLKAVCHPGDGVAVMTPVYNCFFSSIRNNGCLCVDVPLVKSNGDCNFSYEIDFELLENKLKDPRTSVLLMCNPHNPVGRAWSKDELLKVVEVCRLTNTLLVSDEIHGDLVMPDFKFASLAVLSGNVLENAVVLSSPSKAFNIAGLQIANIITGSDRLYYVINRAINDNEVCDVNPFGVTALIAAYTKGEEWLNRLLAYIHGNYEYLCRRFAEELPRVKVAKLEATYLVWVDVSDYSMSTEAMERYLIDRYKVWINAGDIYGSRGYIRINLATSRAILAEGLSRLIAGLNSISNTR